jgi:hypothetical protein
MKKLTLLLLLVSLFSCDISTDDVTDIEYNIPDGTVSFWVNDATKPYGSSDSFYKVYGLKLADGDSCEVYVAAEGSELDNQDITYLQNLISDDIINNIKNEFDDKIHPKVTTNFAVPTDIDNNNKVKLLLFDIKDGYDPVTSPSYIGGYFYFGDLFTQAELDASGYSNFKSNNGEILYIDIYPTNTASLALKSTVAHEFQHLVNAARNGIVENGIPMPVWIDEGLAMAAESIYQGVDLLEEREVWYDRDPLLNGDSAYGVSAEPTQSIAYGFPLVIWNPYGDNLSVLNNYALSHLFFAWLRIHEKNEGGDDSFLRRIIEDSDNTFQAVLNESGNLGSGSEVNTAAKMMQRFYTANLLGGWGKTTGLESYLGKNSHTGPFFFGTSDSSTVSAYAGGALHFKAKVNNLNVDAFNDDTDMTYAIGNIADKSYDYTSPLGTGLDAEVLIIINSDTNENSTEAKSSGPIFSTGLNYNAVLTPIRPENQQFGPAQKINKNNSLNVKTLPIEAFRIGNENFR